MMCWLPGADRAARERARGGRLAASSPSLGTRTACKPLGATDDVQPTTDDMQPTPCNRRHGTPPVGSQRRVCAGPRRTLGASDRRAHSAQVRARRRHSPRPSALDRLGLAHPVTAEAARASHYCLPKGPMAPCGVGRLVRRTEALAAAARRSCRARPGPKLPPPLRAARLASASGCAGSAPRLPAGRSAGASGAQRRRVCAQSRRRTAG
jgi:hypothetical protein